MTLVRPLAPRTRADVDVSSEGQISTIAHTLIWLALLGFTCASWGLVGYFFYEAAR